MRQLLRRVKEQEKNLEQKELALVRQVGETRDATLAKKAEMEDFQRKLGEVERCVSGRRAECQQLRDYRDVGVHEHQAQVTRLEEERERMQLEADTAAEHMRSQLALTLRLIDEGTARALEENRLAQEVSAYRAEVSALELSVQSVEVENVAHGDWLFDQHLKLLSISRKNPTAGPGSDLHKISVVRPTSDLIQCTNEMNVNIPQLADTLFERTASTSWVVVFKSLTATNHLMVYGNEDLRLQHHLPRNAPATAGGSAWKREEEEELEYGPGPQNESDDRQMETQPQNHGSRSRSRPRHNLSVGELQQRLLTVVGQAVPLHLPPTGEDHQWDPPPGEDHQWDPPPGEDHQWDDAVTRSSVEEGLLWHDVSWDLLNHMARPHPPTSSQPASLHPVPLGYKGSD
ncbi:hypothetical protein CRUP_009459 [Coryphaenoides rupestris]|nr:hypothetical protein CRUP_009459 [Coryphaenoides rupestris]